jgi:hypothetical protein
MKTTELTDVQQMIALWNEKNIARCEMEFTCGGDQMNDTSFNLFDNENRGVICEEIVDYLDNEVYNQVEFYVNSDGHYQGEAGIVTIELNDEGDDFTYSKSSESEWNESFSEVGYCELTEEEIAFVKDKIHSLVGGGDGEATNYKGDCILTDEDVVLLESITDKIRDFATDYQFENSEGEESDWFTYTTDMGEADVDTDVEYDENNPTLIKGNTIAININKSFTVYKDEN